jgi:dihydroorotate dehydrogenase
LAKKKDNYTIPVSLSVAKTNCSATSEDQAGIDDYCACLTKMRDAGVGSYYTINVSCPNTFGGEPFTTADRLDKLLAAISKL